VSMMKQDWPQSFSGQENSHHLLFGRQWCNCCQELHQELIVTILIFALVVLTLMFQMYMSHQQGSQAYTSSSSRLLLLVAQHGGSETLNPFISKQGCFFHKSWKRPQRHHHPKNQHGVDPAEPATFAPKYYRLSLLELVVVVVVLPDETSHASHSGTHIVVVVAIL
jgi:hypothetical protein